MAEQLADAINEWDAPKALDIQERMQEEAAQKQFLGLNLGIGLSLAVDLQGDRVDDASVDGGKVGVSKKNSGQPRVLLESHYFFEPAKDHRNLKKERWGYGPFVAIQGSDDEVIEAFGLGWMVGFKRKGPQEESFNLGLGLIFDPSVKVLGDSIHEGRPLPTGETDVQFKEESRVSAVLSVSFSFN